MRARSLLLPAASLLAGMASAQEPVTGSRVGSHSAMVNNYGTPDPSAWTSQLSEDAALALQSTARCIVKRYPALVTAYLATSSAELPPAMNGALEFCLSRTNNGSVVWTKALSFRGGALKGVLAEAVIREHEYPTLPASATVKRSYASGWIGQTVDLQVVDEMSACLADWRPAESMALMRSLPGSREEATAIAALSPLLASCLRTGATLKTNRTGIRSAIAVALYHRIVDPAPDLAAQKKN